MRKVKVGVKNISIRGLKRKEVKALKKKGFDIVDLKVEQIDDLLDEVFPMVLGPEVVELVEDAAYKVGVRVWKAILAETYGVKDEEKN